MGNEGRSAAALSADHPVVAEQLAYEVDFNELAKRVVAAGLGRIPYVGAVLGAMVGVLWPSREVDVWSQIEARVEALVNQKISALVWTQTQDRLKGLHNVTDDYLYAVQYNHDDPAVVAQKWQIAHGHFRHDLPSFQSPGYELLLLPPFAQFGNLHLMLLRDGAMFGASWGWSQSVVDGVRKQLAETIASYLAYAEATYAKGLADTVARARPNEAKTEPFNTVNRFRREMTLTVLDFTLMWPYFDIAKYPDPVDVAVTREIYSDVVGTAADTGVSIPQNPPKSPISRIVGWGWDRVDAVQVDYPEGGGPDGRSSTGRMGNRSGGSSAPPWGGDFDLARTGAVVEVRVKSGHILNAMWLVFENGSSSNNIGGKYPGGNPSEWKYPGEILSSIKIMGVSNYYKSADAAVFGFKYRGERFPRADPQLLRAFYVGDPAAPAPGDLADRLGLAPDERGQLEQWAQDYGWDSLRDLARRQRAKRIEARSGDRQEGDGR